MRYLRLLLLPFSWLYAGLMQLKNFFYDRGIFKSLHFQPAIISVGNLTVGGTGKTPTIEYLIRLLSPHYKLATLSRGYKRKSKGFRIAGEDDNAFTIGDEPMQFYRKFGSQITVSVGEDRAVAIPYLMDHQPDIQCILLDDAFQQRQIKASLQVLLSDYHHPFYSDYVLPAGLLRESRINAGRADVVVVTKCPSQLSRSEKEKIIRKMRPYLNENTRIFFSGIHYEKPRPLWDENLLFRKNIILVTAIARSELLFRQLNANYTVVRHFRFPDHHFFTRDEVYTFIDCYRKQSNKDTVILFSEKDAVRLLKTPLEDILKSYPVFFQPITYTFAGDGPEFDRLVGERIGHSLKDN